MEHLVYFTLTVNAINFVVSSAFGIVMFVAFKSNCMKKHYDIFGRLFMSIRVFGMCHMYVVVCRL